MNPLYLNVALAVLWTFLSRAPSFTVFVVGLGLGFVLVALWRRLFPGSSYVARVLAISVFVLAVLKELVLSNLTLIRVVLFRSRDRMNPGFLTYDVSQLSPLELGMLCHCLTLTPGTTMVDVLDDGRALLLHALDAADPDAVRRSIDLGLRDPMLRWTRS